MENIETQMALVSCAIQKWFGSILENPKFIEKHVLDVVNAFDTQVSRKGQMKDPENILISAAALLCKERSSRSNFFSKGLFSLLQKENVEKASILHHIITEFSLCVEQGIQATIEHLEKGSSPLDKQKAFDKHLEIFISEIDKPRGIKTVPMCMLSPLFPNIKKAVREANFIASLLG
jgi:hypothetical protein